MQLGLVTIALAQKDTHTHTHAASDLIFYFYYYLHSLQSAADSPARASTGRAQRGLD